MAYRIRIAAILGAALALSGCITVPPAYGPVAGACAAHVSDPATAANPVFFVTTGRPDCTAGMPLALTVERGSLHPYGAAIPDPVRYGIATPGTAQRPRLSLADSAAWHDRLRRDAAASGRILLYVHGYNNTTADALSQADQIAMAARFDGPVVAFLWPSQHALAKYPWDETNARWTQLYFAAVLADLAARAPELVLVAHSMGNDIAIDGLRHLQATAPELAARIRIVVLAAPDIDRELFNRDLAPAIVRPGRRVALFASGRDVALRSGWAVHGNPRAGDLGCTFRLPRRKRTAAEAPRCYPAPRGAAGELTVIDSTDLPGKPIGHSAHIATPEGRAELRRLLAPGDAPETAERGVHVLQQSGQPDCASGPSRLKLDFTVVRCPADKPPTRGSGPG